MILSSSQCSRFKNMATLRYLSRKLFATKINCDCASSQVNYILGTRLFSYVSKEYVQERDPAPVFFDTQTQTLLKSLTRIDVNKVFKKRKLGNKTPEIPTYKFMSDEQLEEARSEAQKHGDNMLQMPPVIKVRQPIENVLFKDPALKGLDTSKMVFTDISFGVKNVERLIVVRELDGTLKEADWEVKDRMNQIYFPRKGRKLTAPKMFEEAYLKELLKKGEFEFILDMACIQYEPNDQEYQRVTSITYQYINDNNGFDALRSTRHFGPFTFFLAWFKIIDNLLLELIETSHIEEGVMLVKLYGQLHNVQLPNVELEGKSNLEVIENYISKYSHKKGPLELGLQAYKDIAGQKQELEEGIKAAHGF